MSGQAREWVLREGGIYQPGLGYVTIKMTRGANPKWDAEQDAAEALMLAAPDLLRACEALLWDFDKNDDYDQLNHPGELAEKFEAARAAIEKATP